MCGRNGDVGGHRVAFSRSGESAVKDHPKNPGRGSRDISVANIPRMPIKVLDVGISVNIVTTLPDQNDTR